MKLKTGNGCLQRRLLIPNVSCGQMESSYSSSSFQKWEIDMALGVVADLIDIDAANKAKREAMAIR